MGGPRHPPKPIQPNSILVLYRCTRDFARTVQLKDTGPAKALVLARPYSAKLAHATRTTWDTARPLQGEG